VAVVEVEEESCPQVDGIRAFGGTHCGYVLEAYRTQFIAATVLEKKKFQHNVLFDRNHACILQHDIDGVLLAAPVVGCGVALVHVGFPVLADHLSQLAEGEAVLALPEDVLLVGVRVSEVLVHVPVYRGLEGAVNPGGAVQLGRLVQELRTQAQTLQEGVAVPVDGTLARVLEAE